MLSGVIASGTPPRPVSKGTGCKGSFYLFWSCALFGAGYSKTMLNGFKEFITRGNVIDLAVGLIIGTAFTAVVTALVESVMMPAIAMLTGGDISFDDWLVFGEIRVGVFLTAVVNFLIVAAALYFAIVMPLNKFNEKRAAKLALEDEVEEEDPQVALLKEIRDALTTK